MKKRHIKLFLNPKNGMTIVSADIRDMMSDYLEHYVHSYTETVSNSGMEIMKEFMALSALNIFSADKNSIYGWNLFLPELKMKFFISVDICDKTFIAKAGTYSPSENDKSRIMLVKYDSLTENKTTSHIAVNYSGNIVSTFEIFFKENFNAYLIKEGAYYYLINKVDAEDDYFLKKLKELKEGTLAFEGFTEMNAASLKFYCGCSRDRIKSMVESVGKEILADLLLSDNEIVAECPRCGLKFAFRKEDFKI